MSCSLLRWELVGWSSGLLSEENAHQGWTRNSLPPIRLSIYIPKQTQNGFIAKDYKANVLKVLHVTIPRSPPIPRFGPSSVSFFPLEALIFQMAPRGPNPLAAPASALVLQEPWRCQELARLEGAGFKTSSPIFPVSTPFSSWNQPIWEGSVRFWSLL